MKNIKKFFAVLIAITMAMVLAVPAFAEGAANYSIKINNTTSGHTYEAYQVFAGDLAGNVLSNITWGQGVNESGVISALKAPTSPIPATDDTTAADVAAALETADAAKVKAFAQVIGQNLSSTVAGTAVVAEGSTTCTISGLAAGYYLVKDENDSLSQADEAYTSFILQVVKDVEVTPKSGKPSVEKKVAENNNSVSGAPLIGEESAANGKPYNDVADYDIGDIIPFQLASLIPADTTTNYEKYRITFNDTMSAGLTLTDGSITVRATDPNNASVIAALPTNAYSVNTVVNPDGTTSITVDVQICGTDTLVGIFNGSACKSNDIKVYIDYTASLNDKAVIGLDGNPNEVYLTYSNNPNVGGEGDTGKTPTDKVIVFTYELDTTKVDGADHDTKLSGAEFILYKMSGETKSYATVANGKLTGWDSDEANATTLVSDTDGLFKVAGLDEGTYYLKETKAPTGYNLLATDTALTITATTKNDQSWTDGVASSVLTALKIAVNSGTPADGSLADGTVSAIIENNKGATLPSTGGMGTTLFTILGIVLMGGAAVLLVAKRRTNK